MLPVAVVMPPLVITFAFGFGSGIGPFVGTPVGASASSDRAQSIAMSYCFNMSASLGSPVVDTTTVEAVSRYPPSSKSAASFLVDAVPTKVDVEEVDMSVSTHGTHTWFHLCRLRTE